MEDINVDGLTMDDGKATKDASRLLMSLGQSAGPESKAIIVAYLRSYFEAGYACAFDHAKRGLLK